MYSTDSDEELYEPHLHNRHRRIFRQRINVNFQTVVKYNERFRMNHEKLETLLNDIDGHISHSTRRSGNVLTPELSCALHPIPSFDLSS